MSDESSGLSTPDLVGSSGSSNDSDIGWDDEPSEGQDEASEPSEKDEAPKAKAAPAKAPEPKPEPKKPTLKKVKINDREELVDEDELIRTYSKAKAGEDKFREAAEIRKQTEQFMEALKADPLSVLGDSRLPINRKELAEKWLLAELEQEMMDPRDRALQEKEAQLKQYQSKEQEAKQAAENERTNQQREIKRQEISQLFSKAMEASALSKDPETAAMAMRDMAFMMRAAKERGIEVSADELAKHAETKYQKAMYALANTLEGEDLISFLGDDVIKKIRKADLARLRSKDQPTKQHTQENWESKSSKPKERMDPYEARERARKMLFGK